MPETGVVVTDVQAGSAAAGAGFRAGDVVLQLGDRRVLRLGDYFASAAVLMVGDTVGATVRRAGQVLRLNLVLAAGESERVVGRELSPLLDGILFAPYFNSAGRRPAGIAVDDIHPRSRGFALGLRPGDVLVALNGQPVLGLADLRTGMRKAQGAVLLRVFRSGRYFQLQLR